MVFLVRIVLKSTQFSLLFSDQGQENLAIISTCVTLLCCVRGREWIGWLVGCWRRVEEEWGVCCVRGRLGFWREKGREISGEGRWERGRKWHSRMLERERERSIK